ncbi:MAG: alpha/beta fold hydrolase [Myxococcota bacterium]
MLDCLEHTPGGQVRASVIWLHGLGASGYDFAPLVPHLGFSDVRFVFPHAPVSPVTINAGHRMPSWYDIRSLDHRAPDRESIDDVRASARAIRELIDREGARGVSPERIVLVGFSQGGAMTLYSALRAQRRLAGAIVLSGYLVAEGTLEGEVTEAGRKIPLWFGHGRNDDVVPLAGGKAAYETVQKLGSEAQWHDYPIAHEVNAAEVAELRRFLQRRLG